MARGASGLWWLERVLLRHYTVLALAVGVLLVANELLGFGADLRRWDWLFVSGFVTLLVALRIALELPRVLHETLVRLSNRGVLTGTGGAADLDRFEDRLHRSTRRSSLAWSGVIALVVILAWLIAKGSAVVPYLPTVVFEGVAGALAGLFVGRAIGYGRLGSKLTAAHMELRPDPDHLDSAAGLRPVGHLYAFQAAVLAIAATFLALWWYLIPLLDGRYDDWRTAYAGLLALVVTLEILAFILPMISFHKIMVIRKWDLQQEADALSREAADLRVRLLTATGEQRTSMTAEIAAKDARYNAIEAMPTWPVDARLRRRFTLNNGLLLLPVLAQALGLSDDWKALLENVQKVSSGGS